MILEDQLLSQYTKIFTAVTAYWVVSIFTVFVNKNLLSSKDIDLDAPLFITWFQCIVSVFICFFLSKFAKCYPEVLLFPEGNPYTIDNVKRVLPLSILFTLMIASNNLCLKYVDVSFYYIGRSLTTVFNVIFTYLLLGKKTSFRCILCCAIIIGGFWLGVDQENIAGSLSIIGTFFGILGSLSLSLYSIHTKQVILRINEEIWLLSYYNNAYSFFLFIPFILFSGEYQIILNYNKFNELHFWLTMIAGGVCGFAIGYVSALQIQVTSPLTHNISGTAKACVQTVLASYWYNGSRNFLWWISNFVILGASAMYARFKQLDLEKTFKKEKSVLISES